MSSSKVGALWSNIWLLVLFAVGVISFAAPLLSQDPYLIERAVTLAIPLLFIPIFITKMVNLRFKKNKSYHLQLFGTILVSFALVKSNISFPAPLVFFLFLLLLLTINTEIGIPLKDKQINLCEKFLIATLAILFVMYLSNMAIFFQQGNRFVGFFFSPTTFATWLTCLFIISFANKINSEEAIRSTGYILCLLAVGFFVYASGTRINLIVILILSLLITNKKILRKKSHRIILISLTVTLVLLIYPTYSLVSEHLPVGIIAYRYEGGDDASFGLRMALFQAVLDSISSSGVAGFLGGNGAESSRLVIINTWGIDLFPHNDTIRIIHDFGAIFSLVFFLLICTLGSRNKSSAILAVLYIMSFMHNMIYSHYIVALLLITSNTTQPAKNSISFRHTQRI